MLWVPSGVQERCRPDGGLGTKTPISGTFSRLIFLCLRNIACEGGIMFSHVPLIRCLSRFSSRANTDSLAGWTSALLGP